MKKSLILTTILFVVVILLIAGFFVYQGGLKLENIQTQSSNQVSDWQTYQNKKYGYQINYPKNWATREFPDTGTGAGFRLTNEPSDPYHEFIAIDWGARPSNYCNVSFDEYVKKYGAAVEIQNYETLNSISQITTDSGIIGYETTWKYKTFQGEEKISLPITYFPSAENNCSAIRVSLSNANFMKEYDQILVTFKSTK